MSNTIKISDLSLSDTICTKQCIYTLSNKIDTISVDVSNISSFVNTSISSLSGDVSYLRDDLEFTKQITKNTTKFRLLANKTIIPAGTQSDTLTQFMALSSNVGMFSSGKIYETEMITMKNIGGIPHIYECIKQTTGTQDVSNTTYWKEITDDIYTKDSSDNKYYYRYQNDVPAQTQHFITIYSSQPLTAQNIKIDWGDETIIDLYQKSFDDLSDMWESSKENVLNSSKKTAIYVKEPPIKNDMNDDFEVEIHIKHNYLESMSSDIQAFDMTIDGNSYWGLRSDNSDSNKANPKNLIDRIWAIGYPFMDGILNTSSLLVNNKRIIQVQLPAYSTFITTLYNISSMFKNCINLIAMNGFAKRTWFQQLRAVTSLFEGCSSLINSDVMIPRMMSHESVMSDMYKNCKRLCRNVNTVFMPNGFIDRKVNLTGIFSGCKSLPASSNFAALRDIMWNDNTKIWNFTSTFGGTSDNFKQNLSSEVNANHSSDISMTELQKMWT